jgi:hypothetical protein
MSELSIFHADIKNMVDQAICYAMCSKLNWHHVSGRAAP